MSKKNKLIISIAIFILMLIPTVILNKNISQLPIAEMCEEVKVEVTNVQFVTKKFYTGLKVTAIYEGETYEIKGVSQNDYYKFNKPYKFKTNAYLYEDQLWYNLNSVTTPIHKIYYICLVVNLLAVMGIIYVFFDKQ